MDQFLPGKTCLPRLTSWPKSMITAAVFDGVVKSTSSEGAGVARSASRSALNGRHGRELNKIDAMAESVSSSCTSAAGLSISTTLCDRGRQMRNVPDCLMGLARWGRDPRRRGNSTSTLPPLRLTVEATLPSAQDPRNEGDSAFLLTDSLLWLKWVSGLSRCWSFPCVDMRSAPRAAIGLRLTAFVEINPACAKPGLYCR